MNRGAGTTCVACWHGGSGGERGKAVIVGCVNVGWAVCVSFVRFASLGAGEVLRREAGRGVESGGTREVLVKKWAESLVHHEKFVQVLES